MNIINEIKILSPKFSAYSEPRMPYTFHHDYMRSEYPNLYSSRADVAAAFRDFDDEHLYSIAFLYLVKTSDSESIFNLSSSDFNNAKDIIAIAHAYLQKI